MEKEEENDEGFLFNIEGDFRVDNVKPYKRIKKEEYVKVDPFTKEYKDAITAFPVFITYINQKINDNKEDYLSVYIKHEIYNEIVGENEFDFTLKNNELLKMISDYLTINNYSCRSGYNPYTQIYNFRHLRKRFKQ